MSTVIQVVNVSKNYQLGKTVVTALREVSLDVHQGDFLCLAGPSGSGKSTLLNLIGALDHPSSGQIRFLGQDLATMNDTQITRVRLNHLGFIFQGFNLLPVLTVAENVQYPLILQKTPNQAQRVREALAAVGLAERADHLPDELSGGQRQRVAIARALVTQPEVVLADEPTANLDSVTGSSILELMETLNREHAVTFIFASHDPKIISRARRTVEIRDGQLVLSRRVTLQLPCRLEGVQEALAKVSPALEGVAPEHGTALLTALNEALLNVVRHSQLASSALVDLWVSREPDMLTARIEDDGKPLDPGDIEGRLPALDPLPESGMGWFLIRACMDTVSYHREKRNVLTMVRFLDRPQKGPLDE